MRSFTKQVYWQSETLVNWWLGGICQLFSQWKLKWTKAANCDAGLLSTKVSGTSLLLLQPVGDEVCISQAFWSLLLCSSACSSVISMSVLFWWYQAGPPYISTTPSVIHPGDRRLDILGSQPVVSPIHPSSLHSSPLKLKEGHAAKNMSDLTFWYH